MVRTSISARPEAAGWKARGRCRRKCSSSWVTMMSPLGTSTAKRVELAANELDRSGVGTRLEEKIQLQVTVIDMKSRVNAGVDVMERGCQSAARGSRFHHPLDPRTDSGWRSLAAQFRGSPGFAPKANTIAWASWYRAGPQIRPSGRERCDVDPTRQTGSGRAGRSTALRMPRARAIGQRRFRRAW